MVHQSNAYFERCHAADYDPSVAVDTRRQCWTAWLEHYTVGQPPDRVAYARERLDELEDGEDVQALPGMRTSSVGTSYTASFLTTHARPEVEGDDAEDGDTEGEGAGSVSELENREQILATDQATTVPEPPPESGGACASVCTPRWNECMEECDGRSDACREACETEHRTCMRGCY